MQFTLSEKLSNPERVEKRRAGTAVAKQSAPGQSVSAAAGGDATEQGEELSGFEKTLKKLDNWLA
ncbi:hypothetical protein D3C80_1903080 [compost metagenome]